MTTRMTQSIQRRMSPASVPTSLAISTRGDMHESCGASRATGPPIVHEVLRSPGQPLDVTTGSFIAPRFGCDFSRVRVHTDPPAADAARSRQMNFTTVALRRPSYSLEIDNPGSETVTPLEEGGSKETPAPKPAATSSCGEVITWVPKSPVPTDITADSAVEFAGKIDQALGGNPHTNISVSFASDID